MSAQATKDTTINFRATSETKNWIDRAASLLGTDRTSFIVQTVVERAMEVVEKHNTVTLSDRDRDTFLELLKEDTPNEKLREAYRARQELLND
jgi:uncharacterized protein (DUF1778 family)